ncbi:MAG: serine protease [Proteobacteria bacterium]|nr:serine protease [Pseudomonadota bacterium]
MTVKLYNTRQRLYRKIESSRKSRVLAYVTGDRRAMETQVAADVTDMFAQHLDEVFPTKRISLILYTRGGNTLGAWNLVNMIRMFCDELEVIVPAKAHSAGTLICLGADKIVMTKQATLGPIDPSITGPLNPPIHGAAPDARAPVSVEAVKGYIEMAKADFGVTGSDTMARVLIDLAQKVHPLVLGAIFRSRSQIQFIASQLLKHQVSDASKTQKIIDFLCSESGSHDYTINRREAEQLGLKMEKASTELYSLLRSFYQSVREELELSSPFDPAAIVGAQPAGQPVAYRCVRSFIESTAARGFMFVSEGQLTKMQINTPMGPQEAINDTRTFDGWRQR